MFELKEGKKGYLTLYYEQKPLHSLFDPQKEADQYLHIHLKDFQKGSLVIIGIGLGYLLRSAINYFKEKEIKGSFILGIFLDPLEKEAFETVALLNNEECMKVKFCLWSDKGSLNQFIEQIMVNGKEFSPLSWITYTPITTLFPKRLELLQKSLKQMIHYQTQTFTTRLEFAAFWVQNIIMNLKQMFQKQKRLYFEEDVLLVAAGPTLSQNLAFIESFQDKMPIIALDTALPVLYERGIVPNIVVSCDSQVHNYYHFFAMIQYHQKHQAREKPFLLADITHYAPISMLFDKIVFCHTKEMAPEILSYFLCDHSINKLLCSLEAGGSVASFALSYLTLNGVKRVLLVGQDLSYHYLTHSKATISYYRSLFGAKREIPFWNFYKDIIKKKENQSFMLENLSHWIEDFFRIYSLKGIHKDPLKEISSLEPWSKKKNYEWRGSYGLTSSMITEEEKSFYESRLKRAQHFLKELRKFQVLKDYNQKRIKFDRQEKDFLDFLLMKPDLYWVKNKNAQSDLYLGSMLTNIDHALRALKRTLNT